MTDALIAVALTVGVLAVFGVTMFTLDLLAKGGQWWARPLVETYAPAVYTAVLVVAFGAFLAMGRLDVVAVLQFRDPWGAVAAVMIAPLAALVWYVVELAVASAQVRAGGMLEPINARETAGDLAARPWVWWVLAAVCAVVEEFIFRGMLQSAVIAQWGAVAAVVLGALLFGLHHISFGVPSIVSKTVGGAFMGVQTLLAGSIIPAIVAHLCFQALVFHRLRRRAVNYAH